MKIIIVMTYLDRQYQLDKTLESLKASAYKNFEVLIIDDGSKEEIKRKEYPFNITVLKTYNKKWVNGVPAYNMGFYYALRHGADVVMIQNAECYHVGDVLTYATQNITDSNYIAFGCYSINKDVTFREHNILEVINRTNIRARHDGETGWYTHPMIRRQPFHFCSAITAGNLQKLNGFDERFSYGYAFEDVHFIHQVRCLSLRTIITTLPDPIVVHQYHYENRNEPEFLHNVAKNGQVYKRIKDTRDYRALHEITLDL